MQNKLLNIRLQLQAQEAERQGFTKLAQAVSESISEDTTKSYSDLQELVYNKLWECAYQILNYHDVIDSDISNLDEIIDSCTEKFISEIESKIDKDAAIKGPSEPKIVGEL